MASQLHSYVASVSWIVENDPPGDDERTGYVALRKSVQLAAYVFRKDPMNVAIDVLQVRGLYRQVGSPTITYYELVSCPTDIFSSRMAAFAPFARRPAPRNEEATVGSSHMAPKREDSFGTQH